MKHSRPLGNPKSHFMNIILVTIEYSPLLVKQYVHLRLCWTCLFIHTYIIVYIYIYIYIHIDSIFLDMLQYVNIFYTSCIYIYLIMYIYIYIHIHVYCECLQVTRCLNNYAIVLHFQCSISCTCPVTYFLSSGKINQQTHLASSTSTLKSFRWKSENGYNPMVVMW